MLTVFRCGLQVDVQTELACRNEDLTLDQLITMAIHLDNLLRRRPSRGFGSLPGTSSETEAMEVGTTHLAPEECQRRRQQGLFSYYGSLDQPWNTCPEGEPGEEATGQGVLLHLPR
jgi:hypothetical protein